MKSTPTEIDKQVRKAFLRTIIDYHEQKIEYEEDLRASFYYHLRKYIDKTKNDLFIQLEPRLDWTTRRPDVIIIRLKNEKYVPVAIFELKNVKIPSMGRKDTYDIKKGVKDIKKLLLYKNSRLTLNRGYFLHIDTDFSEFNYTDLYDVMYRKDGKLRAKYLPLNDYLIDIGWSAKKERIRSFRIKEYSKNLKTSKLKLEISRSYNDL